MASSGTLAAPGLDPLRTLVAALRAGPFAAVASERGIDRSSFSRQVARLESALGVRPLERARRRLVLAEVGRPCLERVGPSGHGCTPVSLAIYTIT